jgi:hypothetical protein
VCDHARDGDRVVTHEELAEAALPAGLGLVVELLEHARAHLGDERVAAREREQGREGAELPHVVEISPQRRVDPGVLHLHRDLETALGLVEPRSMHLAKRSRGEGCLLEAREALLDARTELSLHERTHGHWVRAHRASAEALEHRRGAGPVLRRERRRPHRHHLAGLGREAA